MRTATIITMSAAILFIAVSCDHETHLVVHRDYEVYPEPYYPPVTIEREVYREYINSPEFVNVRVVVDVIERDEPEVVVLLNVVDQRLDAIGLEFERARYGHGSDATFSFAIIDAEYELLYRLYNHVDRHYNSNVYRQNELLRKRLAAARQRIENLRQRNRNLRKKLAEERAENDRLARQNKRLKNSAPPVVGRKSTQQLPPRGKTPPPEVIVGRRDADLRSGTATRTTQTVINAVEKNRIERDKPKKGDERPIIVQNTETRTVTKIDPNPKAVARIEKIAENKQTRQDNQLAAQQAKAEKAAANQAKQAAAQQQKAQQAAANQAKQAAAQQAKTQQTAAKDAQQAAAKEARQAKQAAAKDAQQAKQLAASQAKAERAQATQQKKQEKQAKKTAKRTAIASDLD